MTLKDKYSFSPVLFLMTIILCMVGVPFSCGAGQAAPDHQMVMTDDEQSYKVGDPRLDTLWISEKSGTYLPLDTEFRDERGEAVKLQDIIDRPTIILPIYFYCPSACSLNLANLAKALRLSSFQPGNDFRTISLSFNDKENEENASLSKTNYMRLLPEDFPEDEWKFLTGTKENIRAVTDAIGYTFKPSEGGMFIHPSALVVVGADGLIIKYVYGSFIPGDVDMGILEAQSGTPSLSVKRLLRFCFNYDPKESRTFFRNLKISVLLGAGLLAILFIFYLRRGGNKAPKSNDTK